MRGDFNQAMDVLWPVADTYWGDVAYLAERVLTTEELKAFVDAKVEPVASAPDGTVVITPAYQLRGLLARRLMREERYSEALAYFKTNPEAKTVPAFIQARKRERTAFWISERAEAHWQAARILRQDGLQLFGTETSPDQFGLDANFVDGYGQEQPFTQAGTYTPQERARYDASTPEPDLRWHYRYLAVDEALAAADRVSPRSQAYAAILCHAAGWMLETQRADKAAELYQLYKKNGAVLPFAKHFGHDCPDPDFQAIPETRKKLFVIAAKRLFHDTRRPIAITNLTVAASTGVLLFRMRGLPRRGLPRRDLPRRGRWVLLALAIVTGFIGLGIGFRILA